MCEEVRTSSKGISKKSGTKRLAMTEWYRVLFALRDTGMIVDIQLSLS